VNWKEYWRNKVHRWPKKKVEEIAVHVGGGTPSRKSPAYWGEGIPWFTVADLSDDLRPQLLTKSREDITLLGLNNSAAKIIPKGAIVFSVRVVVGKVGIAQNEIATNQDFISLVPKAIIDSEYLSYALLYLRNNIRHNQQGATIRGIRKAHLLSVEISVPPLTEQRRIVARIKDCLDRVDEIKNLHEETFSEMQALLPSFLSERFNQILKNSEVTTINDAAVETRYGTSRKCNTQGRGMVILRIPNVAEGLINLNNLKYCELNEIEIEKLKLRKGDLLFVRTNGSKDLVGRCAVFDRDEDNYGFASYLIRLRLNQNVVLPQYLSLFLESTFGRDAIDQMRRTSAGQFNINSENLRSIKFPKPGLKTQEELVNQLFDYRKKIIGMYNEIKNTFDYTASLRESILQKAFAGEL
jgi:type I restriction enzyme S subunit